MKLGYLAVKQISKPLANVIKLRAKKHPFFRKYVCMPPAQSNYPFHVFRIKNKVIPVHNYVLCLGCCLIEALLSTRIKVLEK